MFSEKDIIEAYNLHKKELIIYLFRLIGSQETAEDILHDSIINLLNYSKTHEINDVRAFLYKTVHNLAVNHAKKFSKVKYVAPDEYSIPVFDSIEATIEKEEFDKKLYDILEELDDLSRSVFIMKKDLNMSIPEIAKNIGKSEKTVKRKLEQVTEYLLSKLKISGFA